MIYFAGKDNSDCGFSTITSKTDLSDILMDFDKM